MTPLTLRLPWPPPELSPNARPHWAQKSAATRAYRWECFSEGRPYRYLPQCRATGPRTAKVVFVVPTRHRRDLDNCMAMLKPCWDGLVDAGLLVDDDSKHLKLAAPEMRVEKGSRYVEITLS